jgi:cytochrome P450
MDSSPQSRGNGHARAGVLDLLHLGATLGADFLRGRRSDPGAAGNRWAHEVMKRDGGADVDIGTSSVELIGNREHSNTVLEARPGPGSYEPGPMKTKAMTFLAPGALTIATGDSWTRLRPFNEKVLGTGEPHPFAQTFVAHVRGTFAGPMRGVGDVRDAMGRAMVKIVLGDVNPSLDPAGDVSTLFGVVQSPVKRALFGFLYKRRRARLYNLLERKWETAGDRRGEQTLLTLASRQGSDADRATLLQQIPHWMFTFTGSGTDLLVRALCMITSRADVHAQVLDEIRAVGPLDRAETVGRLAYLNACLMETGRLFPPVTRTFHRDVPKGSAAKRELVHYFPLLQRDESLGPTVHHFNPDRWLSPTLDAAASASNLFLRGPRACPGMDLILFVCKAAIARQLGELHVSARQDRLTRDPLPVSFPKISSAFTVTGARR